LKRRLYDIAEGIQQADKQGKVVPSSKPITVGLKAQDPPFTPGLHYISPSQALNIFVDVLHIEDGQKSGYQRKADPAHVRRVARQLREGYPFPPVLLAVENGNYAEAIDGQHRLLGAVMARKSAWVAAVEMTEHERQQLFAGQRKAKTVDRATLILAGDGPVEEYIQDAVTSSNHPWSRWIVPYPSSNHIPVPTAYAAIASYGMATLRTPTGTSPEYIAEHWRIKPANELADLISAFGTRQTNPDAFANAAFRGIVQAAIVIVRRRGSKPADVARWHKRMRAFPWRDYPQLRSSMEWGDALIAWWNKGLKKEQRVVRVSDEP
jgi:hypothetical protein